MRRCSGVAVALSLFLGGAVAAAADDQGCVSGPARLASAQRPHLTDPSGDAQLPHNPVTGPDGYDIIAYWVGVDPEHSADDPHFTVNVQVADIDQVPVHGAVFVLTNGRYFSAKKNVLGEFEFQWGVRTMTSAVADGYDPSGWTDGWTDDATDTISIVMPPGTVPARSPNGHEVALPPAYVHTGDALDSPVAPPFGVPVTGRPDTVGTATYVDYTAGEQCAAVLFEAEDDATEPSST